MTTAARRVLCDCQLAARELAPLDDPDAWRRRWITALVLLRAVGHVLHKVDGETSHEYRAAIDAWWKTLQSAKQETPIFWSFIEAERNSILKEYRSTGVQVVRTTVRFHLASGQRDDPPTTYVASIEGGPYDGRSQGEVVLEAITWWREQLRSIDQAAQAAAPPHVSQAD